MVYDFPDFGREKFFRVTGFECRDASIQFPFGMILQPFVDIFFYLYMLQIVDTFVFNKYCDDGYAPKGMYFNDVRILQSFSGTEETRQEEIDNAIRNYSIIINFNVED